MKNKKLLLIDILALMIIVGAITLAVMALKPAPTPEGKPVILTMTVTRNADLIYEEAAKLGQILYGGSETPVTVTKVVKTTRGDLPALAISLESKGEIEKDRILFHGYRVLVGQKTELHGRYFAQGVVSDVEYK